MRTERPTANERFKRRARRLPWIAFGVAVAAHIALFIFMPPFTIDSSVLPGFRPRMIVSIREYEGPACPEHCRPGYERYDTAMAVPELLNLPELTGRVPRLYPRLLWTYEEPSSASFNVVLRRSGRLQDVVLLESRGNGADDALLALVRMMRFAPLTLPDTVPGLIFRFEVGVETP